MQQLSRPGGGGRRTGKPVPRVTEIALPTGTRQWRSGWSGIDRWINSGMLPGGPGNRRRYPAGGNRVGRSADTAANPLSPGRQVPDTRLWTNCTTMEPSPTADATRFVDP